MNTRTFRLGLLFRAPLSMGLLLPAALLWSASAAPAIEIDWATVGDPGNSCEAQTEGCFGAVAYEYRISRFEVTWVQYIEFLEAVARTDPNDLYHPDMTTFGGIRRFVGSSGLNYYSLIAGRENLPVMYANFWDWARFANWLHNGQPKGAQDNTTTEDGAYTLTPDTVAANSVTRNEGARVFIASEDEWYKAAYYKGGGTSAGYWDYPAGSDTQMTCAEPGATPNTALCWDGVSSGTPVSVDVGSYPGSASPSGTFDQGGNAIEWLEDINAEFGPGRVLRGGSSSRLASSLASSWRGWGNALPDRVGGVSTIRVAAPASVYLPSMSPLAISMLCCLVGLVSWRTLRS